VLIPDITLTPELARWLCESHDDGQPELDVQQRLLGFGRHRAPGIEITRADGSEPSETERLEINARLAAHAVEPLKETR
jgi:hypothetical protein